MAVTMAEFSGNGEHSHTQNINRTKNNPKREEKPSLCSTILDKLHFLGDSIPLTRKHDYEDIEQKEEGQFEILLQLLYESKIPKEDIPKTMTLLECLLEISDLIVKGGRLEQLIKKIINDLSD